MDVDQAPEVPAQAARFVVRQNVCRLYSFDGFVGEFFGGFGILAVELVDHFRKRSRKLTFVHHLFSVLSGEFWIESGDARE